MNPSQQQYLQQWQGWLQQMAGQVSGILQEAEVGCRQLVASHPTDPIPLSNALQAIQLKIGDVVRQVETAWSQQIDQSSGFGSNEVLEYGTQANEGLEQWVEETWSRFRSQWRVEGMKAMWAHVEQLMGRPVPCPQCGSEIRPKLRHIADTVCCPHCNAVNQTTPALEVATFYQLGPDVWAEAATLDKRLEIEAFRRQVKAQLRQQRYAGNDSAEPLESLQRWEAMEREHWRLYVASRAQLMPIAPEEQEKIIDARMKPILDELQQSDAWRRSQGMEAQVEVAQVPMHLRNVDEWGPLRQDQYEEFVYQAFMLDESRQDPSRFRALLAQFGYRDNEQFERVRMTFNRHVDPSDPRLMQVQLNARQRASRDQMAQKTAASSEILAPIEGVTIEQYAGLAAKQAAGIPPFELQQLLAQQGMDQAKFDRVAKAWVDRMSRDTAGVLATAYSNAFSAAGASSGGINPASVPFETFCEIMGAQSAWATQGKDANAMLKQVFNMTALDWSNISAHWMPKLQTDMNLGMRMGDLMMAAQQKYLAM